MGPLTQRVRGKVQRQFEYRKSGPTDIPYEAQ